jgi:hypothetical protein
MVCCAVVRRTEPAGAGSIKVTRDCAGAEAAARKATDDAVAVAGALAVAFEASDVTMVEDEPCIETAIEAAEAAEAAEAEEVDEEADEVGLDEEDEEDETAVVDEVTPVDDDGKGTGIFEAVGVAAFTICEKTTATAKKRALCMRARCTGCNRALGAPDGSGKDTVGAANW